MRALLLVPGAALLAACAVGPDYRRPDTPAPAQFDAVAANPIYAQQAAQAGELAQWWTLFNDPKLNHLVDEALTGNLDIQSAAARIAQARAEREEAAGALFPSLAGSAKGSRYRVPDSLRELPQQTESAVAPGAPPIPLHLPGYVSIYQVGFDASWELDLFGGNRRTLEAADASTQAQLAARRGVVVSTLAELGNDYAALRATQARVAIALHTVDVETSLLELTRSQKGSGLASELDVARAQGQLDTTMAQLPLLEAQRLQAVHAIAILLGHLPETTDDELTADAPQLPLPPSVPMELPSAVLQNRPDIQQAERELAAATAQIGVAEAERFPSLSLTGSTGMASSQLDQLLRHSNWTWNAGASLSAPIFEGGRLQAQQKAAEAAAQQSDLQYRKTVLQAFRETEDALQGYAAQIQHYDSLAGAVAAGQVSLARATDLYRAGLGNYLDVLDADRSVAQLQDQLAQGGQDRVQQLIALYKALGGGWQAGERNPDQVDQVVAPAPVASDAAVSAPAAPNPPPPQ